MKEQDRQPQSDDSEIPLAFTDNERLFSVLSHARFIKFVTEPTNVIYKANVDANSYGEFLFVSIGILSPNQTQDAYTFFGLGFHEYRDRYFTNEWHFYRCSLKFDKPYLTSEELVEIIHQRHEDLAIDLAQHTQSKRGRLFEEIADLTDDDGAISDFDDFLDFFDDAE